MLKGLETYGRALFVGALTMSAWAASSLSRAAEAQPDAAMLAPVQRLVAFMSVLPAERPSVFASRGVCIIENFSPFIFCGDQAAVHWEQGFRAHAAAESLSELVATFAAAYDFNRSEDRVYFSLPTLWEGRTAGRRFEEHGAWSFVLERKAGRWTILGYSWGVTAYVEREP